jgi:isopentenyl diphosphate isomerase/L-lactate dehydrogenase-like FMN-dependent dehydrogenase
MEAVTAVNHDAWFQLYMIDGRDGAGYAMDVARKARCRVLVVTVDVVAMTPQDRVSRPLPMRADLPSFIAFLPEVWNKPRWLLSFLRGGLTLRAPNAARKTNGSEMTLAEAAAKIAGAPPSWDDLKWIRAQWDGPLLLKGVLRIDDARRAIDIGADAISVSNHGAKVFDGTPSAVSLLPEIVEAVDAQIEVLLDGGVRRGADVVRACALGAKAVLIGRPYLWGLAAAGQKGVSEILQLFHRGIETTLAQLGCPSIAALDRSWLRPLPRESQWSDAGAKSRVSAS